VKRLFVDIFSAVFNFDNDEGVVFQIGGKGLSFLVGGYNA